MYLLRPGNRHVRVGLRRREQRMTGGSGVGSGMRTGNCTCGIGTRIRGRGRSRRWTRSGWRGASTSMALPLEIRSAEAILTASGYASKEGPRWINNGWPTT